MINLKDRNLYSKANQFCIQNRRWRDHYYHHWIALHCHQSYLALIEAKNLADFMCKILERLAMVVVLIQLV